MARHPKHYWTRERLRELEELYTKKQPSYLVAHFGKPWNLLCAVYDYAILHKKLKISSRKKGRRRVTIYKPGYAEGAEPPHIFTNRTIM